MTKFEDPFIRNFYQEEFECHHCRAKNIQLPLVRALQEFRDYFSEKYKWSVPLNVHSGYRCIKHPVEAAKTNKNGFHVQGKAADISTSRLSVKTLYEDAVKFGKFDGIGVDPVAYYIHVDIRGWTARWQYKEGQWLGWNGKWDGLIGVHDV